MMKMKKSGNQGFSLVEVMVVMAIIVIVGGFALAGLSIVTSRPVDECAKKIQIALEGSRNTTMGKLSASISFYTDADGNVYVEEIIDGGTPYVKKIGQDSVDVQYVKDDGTSSTLTTTRLTIEFDRASGSLKPQAADGKYISSFVVSRGSVGDSGYRQITVSIDKLTGRVSVQ